jgi:LPXTG-site transpeptidase (sortase) family protein
MVTGRRGLAAAALLGLAVVLAASGLWLNANRSASAPSLPAPEPQAIISPDAYRVFPTAATSVPHEGLRVQLPQLDIDLPIVDGDGFNAPLNKAAHYPGLAWPGERGRSVIYAHARPGMFGPLFNAKVGETVQITNDSGDARRYTITEYYSHWPIRDLKWLQRSDQEQLVLVTCTTYNYDDPRIVVVAEPG